MLGSSNDLRIQTNQFYTNLRQFVGSMKLFTKTKIKRSFRFLVLGFTAVVLVFFWLNLLFPLRVNIDFSKIIADKDGNPQHIFLNRSDKWRIKVELHEISEDLRRIIVFKEDKYFYYHLGINPLSILRALAKNLLSARVTSGASTITMQVARMLEPRPRNIKSKIIEAFCALQLEWQYSKDEILQMYLNLVPYGGNIEGAKSASLLFLGVEPEKLSPAQVVTLAIVPNRPTSLALGKNNQTIEKERNTWIQRLARAGILSPQQAQQALSEPLDARRRTPPRNMPHLANYLRAKHPDKDFIATTIDPNLQDRIEKLAYQYIQHQKNFNINNSAILMVENSTRNVVAYLGSPDFGDSQHGGQVNGVLAYRSPGSALKPLLYGIAFDQGLITPATVLYDVPYNFDGYAPENFDLRYRGKISAQDALATSLNITAVKLLDQIGKDKVIEKLSLCGFRRVERDRSNLGLSLALGGCATNLWELTGLYASLAQQGKYLPLNVLNAENSADSDSKVEILSPQAAYMLAQILTTAQRPDIPNASQSALNIPQIAWKTGTSYGRRDAWCLGFNRLYTVGVWVGNFDNTGVQELTGGQVAAPLLFKIFQNLPNQWLSFPEKLQTRLVCKETGLPVNSFCFNAIEDFFIPGVSSSQVCTHMKEYITDEAEKMTYCKLCQPANGYKRVLFENFDPALKNFYLTTHSQPLLPPPHNPDCQSISTNIAPKITSPLPKRKYTLLHPNSQIALSCQTSTDIHYVYWYVNNQFYAKSEAAKTVFLSPPKGRVKISCTDERGKNTDIEIFVD